MAPRCGFERIRDRALASLLLAALVVLPARNASADCFYCDRNKPGGYAACPNDFSFNFPATESGRTVYLNICTDATSCPTTMSSSADWLLICSYGPCATSRALSLPERWCDNYGITVRALENKTSASRTATVTVGTASITVTQAGGTPALVAVEAVDPNPSLLSSGAVVSDPERIAADGRPVIMAAADGITMVLLRISTSGSGTVELSVMGGSPADGGLAPVGGSTFASAVDLPIAMTSKGSRAFALYRVPDDFNRGGDEAAGERTVSFAARFVPDTGSPVESRLDFKLVRPPVVLLHGLWSKPGAWTFPLLSDARFRVTLGDYEDTNASSFSRNQSVPRTSIREALEKLRLEGAAVTQVDLAGHSMGGILSRNHVGGALYRKSTNYYAGDVHKLVTLNTPHTGSPLANLLAAIRNDPIVGDLFADAARVVGHAVDEGAVDDLSKGSSGLLSISATRVPSHALIGVGGSSALTLGPGTLGAFYRLVSFFGSTIGLFGSLQHDFVVGRDSQEGGIPLAASTTFAGTDSIHIFTNGSSGYSSRLVDLWNTPTASGVFANFPAVSSLALPELPQVAVESSTPKVVAVSTGAVITTPVNGTTATAGTTVTVTVSSVSTPFSAVLVFGPLATEVDELAPFEVSFPIPSSSIGPYPIAALGVDSNGNYYTSTPVNLNVVTSATLTGVRLLPRDPILFGEGSTRRSHLTGLYGDGQARDLSLSTLGTSYQTSAPTIASVSSNGLITAQGLGTTTLVARNGGYQDSVTIRVVQSLTPVGDVNESGSVGPDDMFYLINFLFAAGAPPLGPADVNGSGAVGADDVFYLINHLFAAGPGPVE